MKATTIPYSDKGSFLESRDKLISRDELAHADSHISLSEDERLVDVKLEKTKEITKKLFFDLDKHPAATHFADNKSLITENPLFEFVSSMPKGILQHIHSATTCDPFWIVEKAQLESNCCVYWQEDEKEIKGKLKFFKKGEMEDGYISASKVDSSELYDLLTLNSTACCCSLKIEKKLVLCYERIRHFASYEPVFEDYYTQAFLSLIKDNLQGAELRLEMPEKLYGLGGKSFDAQDTITRLRSALEAAKQISQKEHFSIKVILSTQRSENQMELIHYLNSAFSLKEANPSFVAGFDISGDNNWPEHFRSYKELTENISDIRDMDNEHDFTMPLYFHDSENISVKDKSLYDAVLLECKRIGMSLNLFKFPELEKVVREMDIQVEILPMSNQA